MLLLLNTFAYLNITILWKKNVNMSGRRRKMLMKISSLWQDWSAISSEKKFFKKTTYAFGIFRINEKVLIKFISHVNTRFNFLEYNKLSSWHHESLNVFIEVPQCLLLWINISFSLLPILPVYPSNLPPSFKTKGCPSSKLNFLKKYFFVSNLLKSSWAGRWSECIQRPKSAPKTLIE